MVRPRTICLLLALITVLAYSPVRLDPLVVFDDPLYVENPHVQAGLTSAGIRWAFTTFYASNWHPLTWLSHMLDASLFGPRNSGAEHLVNVLFHAANAVLLFLLLLRMTNRIWAAAFVAALFAWHPLRVESVAWVSERKDVLSTFFGLLTLLAYVKYVALAKAHPPSPRLRRTGSPSASAKATTDKKSKGSYICALALFALSLMAKPMLVTLPFVLLLLDVWPLSRTQLFGIGTADPKAQVTEHGTRNAILPLIVEKLPFFALTIASSVVTYLAQRGEAVMSFEQRPLGLRVANALVSYAEYLGKTVWPARLAIIYPLPNSIPAWQIGGAAVLLATISFFVWITRKNRPYLLIGWLWFLGTLVPVIGLVQVGGQALADRYTYVPSIGLFLALGYAGADLSTRWPKLSPAVSVLGAITAAATFCVSEYQLGFWKDSETLFSHALAVTRENAVAHINLGVALEQDGHPEQAKTEYESAIRIDPQRVQAHNNLANLLAAAGSRDEALKEYQAALRLNPNAAETHINLGTLLSEMGRFDDAMKEFAEGTRLAPEDPRPYYLMGKACLQHGQSAEALKNFRDALQRDPNNFEALTWLARVQAADSDPAIRNGAQAVSLAERANDLTGGEQPFIWDTLAMAYAEAGRFPDAQAAEQKAIDLATAAGAQKTVPEMQKRLALYQAAQPYRDDFAKTSSD